MKLRPQMAAGKSIVLYVLVVLSAISFNRGANLIFNSGFEEGAGPYNAVLSDITGTDNSVIAPNDWSSDVSFRIDYHCGENTDRWAKIVEDPTDPDNRVMHFWMQRSIYCTASTRVQSIVTGVGSCVFQRVRMYLHPDMLLLLDSGLPAESWFLFQEIWIRPNWTGQDNPFRIDFNLARGDVNGTEQFYWYIYANECCDEHITFWEVENTAVPVPIGEWFTAEMYYKMGDGDNGRIMFRIQREGHAKETVADVTDWTYHPDESPRGIVSWQPHKLYVRDTNVDYVREHGGALQIYWDDWELWDDMPEDGPDTTPPTIISVAATSSTAITINFSEKVDPATAGDTGNYSISNGITVSAAALASNEASVTLTTSPLTKDATYTLTVSGINDQADTPNTITTVQKTLCWDDCLGSSGIWQNFVMAEQTETFEATYDATPRTATCNGLVTFSAGDAADYSDCAVLVRFNDAGKIDVRNGGAYAASQDISYEADVTYRFRVVVNVPGHTYSVYVTPDGGSETTLAADYAFRSDQSDVTALDTWGFIDDTGSFRLCDMDITAGSSPADPDTTPPSVVSVTATGATSVQVRFDELVDPATAGDEGNYTVDNGITVSAAVLESDGMTVMLTTSALAGDVTYTLTVSGVNDRADTPNTVVTVDKTFNWDDCPASSDTWQNFGMDEQTGTFEATYVATPLAATCDGLVTFSNGDAAAYGDCAILVRFNAGGKMDARNGDAYEADQDIPYETGTEYRFRVTADVAARTYSVYVTPDGGSETTLAANYAFRSEQSGVTALDTWSIIDETGSFRVCGFEVGSVTGGYRILPDAVPLGARGSLQETGRMISINGRTSAAGASVCPGVYVVETVHNGIREYRKTLVVE